MNQRPEAILQVVRALPAQPAQTVQQQLELDGIFETFHGHGEPVDQFVQACDVLQSLVRTKPGNSHLP